MNNKTLISYNFEKFECDGDVFNKMILSCKGENASEVSRYINAIIKDESEGNLSLIPNIDYTENDITREGLVNLNMKKEKAIELLNMALYFTKQDFKDCELILM